MASIRSVATAVPAYAHGKEEILQAGSVWLAADHDLFTKFQRFVKNSNTARRHFVIPASELLTLGDQGERAALFTQHAVPLAAAAITKALLSAELSAQSVGAVVSTSCTAPLIPALDTLVLGDLGFADTVFRVPIYQQGCAGGVVGLSLANRLVASSGPVLLSSTELCSLLFYSGDRSGAQLVGSAIFADGAAALLLGPETDGLQIISTQCQLLPGTTQLMGYDIRTDGAHLRLDRALPEAVATAVGESVTRFLGAHGLRSTDIPWWLFHPGGEKILHLLETAFALEPWQCPWGRSVLTNVGNMSSASVLFVLDAFIRSGVWRKGDRALLLGIGPGLTIELVLLEVA